MTRTLTLTLTLALAAAALLVAMPALAQPPSGPQAQPKAYDIRDDATSWINDPNVHAFYQATVEAFAKGPDQLDHDAYLKRSREIFTALAVAHGMPPAALLDHVQAIPDEVIVWAKRDPHTLDSYDSYDSFVVALFGPQKP